MQDEDKRADAFLKETLACICALDKGVRADARARLLAQAIGAVHTLACDEGEAYAS